MLFRSPGGGLTAVTQTDADPVVVPPPPKKASKKMPTASTSGGTSSACAAASAARAAAALARKTGAAAARAAKAQEATVATAAATDGNASSVSGMECRKKSESAPVAGGIRKISSDPAIATMVAKKMRSRARRMTAGQMPGRYHLASPPASVADTDTDTEYMQFLPSPSSRTSLCSLPASPSPFEDGFSLRAAAHHVPVDLHSESPYQFKDPAGEDAFPDLACLGIGGDADSKETPTALSLPSMAADPSSAEHFSFCDSDSVFGAPDPVLVADPLYQRTALTSLIRDHSLPGGRLFQSCACALAQLGLRLLGSRHAHAAAVTEFVRTFAGEHSTSPPNEDSHMTSSGDDDDDTASEARAPHCSMAARLMFPERMVYDHAVDAFRAMCDCADLAIFLLPLLLLVLEEDVASLMTSPNVPITDIEVGSCASMPCDTPGQSISARA